MVKYIERGTNYAYMVERCEDISFKKLRTIAVDFTKRLPVDLANELYENIQHGVCQLKNEPELNMYIHALGLMHEAKLQHAFEHLSKDFTDYPAIEIIDYGCGQAFGTICYADYLRKKGKVQEVKKITLIEPSEVVLKRAALHASYFFPNAEVITILKGFDDLVVEDICTNNELPTLHILSNVIDLADDFFELEQFVKLINDCAKGDNHYICIEPDFDYEKQDKKLQRFVKLLDAKIYYEKTFPRGTFVEGRNWTCRVIICTIDNSFVRKEFTTLIEDGYSEEDFIKLCEASEQGDALAQFELGTCYANGRGVEQDYAEAVKWYCKSAVQGYAFAQYHLGCSYKYGEGVKKNINTAIEWFLKAAMQGDMWSVYSLAVCYDELQEYGEAVKWFGMLAEKGYAGGQYYLGIYYEEGKGVAQDIYKAITWYRKAAIGSKNHNIQYRLGKCLEKIQNYVEALKWYHKAAEEEDKQAQFRIGQCYYNGNGVKRNYNKAVKWYRESAEQGNAYAQNKLGVCYAKGQGVEQNYAEAVKWYRKAAEQGYDYAQNNLGDCYYDGDGVEQDYIEAVKWYRKSAEQGNVNAQYVLGCCYCDGDGVEQDYIEAVKWYRKSAEQGDSYAQFELGCCYYDGEGVEQDFTEAVKWYRMAAGQGDAYAQNKLGICYTKGQGVEQDYAEAVILFRKAAEQGNVLSLLNLGNCYYKGQGVEQNYVEAVKWYYKAVEQGNANAQFNIGVCYAKGQGVEQDYTEAVKWYRKAAEQGYNPAKEALGKLNLSL